MGGASTTYPEATSRPNTPCSTPPRPINRRRRSLSSFFVHRKYTAGAIAMFYRGMGIIIYNEVDFKGYARHDTWEDSERMVFDGDKGVMSARIPAYLAVKLYREPNYVSLAAEVTGPLDLKNMAEYGLPNGAKSYKMRKLTASPTDAINCCLGRTGWEKCGRYGASGCESQIMWSDPHGQNGVPPACPNLDDVACKAWCQRMENLGDASCSNARAKLCSENPNDPFCLTVTPGQDVDIDTYQVPEFKPAEEDAFPEVVTSVEPGDVVPPVVMPTAVHTEAPRVTAATVPPPPQPKGTSGWWLFFIFLAIVFIGLLIGVGARGGRAGGRPGGAFSALTALKSAA